MLLAHCQKNAFLEHKAISPVPLEKAMRQQRITIRKIAWIDGTRISQCIIFPTSLLSKTGSEQLTRRRYW
jgi:hypothetical protein